MELKWKEDGNRKKTGRGIHVKSLAFTFATRKIFGSGIAQMRTVITNLYGLSIDLDE